MDCHYNLAQTTNRMVAKDFCTVLYILWPQTQSSSVYSKSKGIDRAVPIFLEGTVYTASSPIIGTPKKIPQQDIIILNKTPRHAYEQNVTEAFFPIYNLHFKVVLRNFQAVIHDFLFPWSINRWHRGHIPLFIRQRGKVREYRNQMREKCELHKLGNGYKK